MQGSPETVQGERSAGRKASVFARLLPRKIRRDERGAAMVEFALVATPFFLLLGAIIETALLFFADQLLDTATNDAARLIRTGQATDTSGGAKAMTHSQFTNEVCNRLYVLFNCAYLVTDVRAYTSFNSAIFTPPVDADGNFKASDLQYNPGISQGIVVVRAYYLYPLIFSNLGLNLANTGGNKHLLNSVAAFRNEPYPW